MMLNDWVDPIAYTGAEGTVTRYVLENSLHEQGKPPETGEGRMI